MRTTVQTFGSDFSKKVVDFLSHGIGVVYAAGVAWLCLYKVSNCYNSSHYHTNCCQSSPNTPIPLPAAEAAAEAGLSTVITYMVTGTHVETSLLQDTDQYVKYKTRSYLKMLVAGAETTQKNLKSVLHTLQKYSSLNHSLGFSSISLRTPT